MRFASQDPVHCAANLSDPAQYRRWLCASNFSENQNCAQLQLKREAQIGAIRIGTLPGLTRTRTRTRSA